MYADADDLVSRRLHAFVRAQPEAPGWFFDSGYAYEHGARWLHHRTEQHMKCGTCAVFRADLLRFAPQDEYRGHEVETIAAAGHRFYVSEMMRRGTPLLRLPFAGSIYISHPDSTISLWENGAGPGSARPLWRRLLSAARQATRTAPSLRPLTPRLRSEFTIPRRDSIPPAWR